MAALGPPIPLTSSPSSTESVPPLITVPAVLEPPAPIPRESKAYKVPQSRILYHHRFGHLGAQNLAKMPQMCDGIELPKGRKNQKDPDCLCDICLFQKGQRVPHNHKIEPGKHFLELIHTDVVGPIPVKGFDGSRYFITFSCDKTKFARVYLVKSKGEVTDCFVHFKNRYERLELGETIRRLQDDNGGEYIAGKLQRYLF
jgi:hypothetical protein